MSNVQSRFRKMRVGSVLLLALLASALPGPAGAASTGSTALFMPQGSGSGTANGDYVTTTGGGLNTLYRYFIEVPPSLSRLRVQIFDADVGAGGATEDTAGRDRDRNGYDTSAGYSLVDPSGTVRQVRFTTGDTTQPTGADNAWLTLYDGNGRDVRDNFGTAAYTNNNGTDNWSAAWNETDAGGAGATTGAIQITGGELRLQDGVSGTPSINREADLLGTPGLNFQQAYLSFDYRTSNNLEDADQISVQVSSNGGGSWNNLQTFSNDSSGSPTYDITPYIANNTRVRFILAGGYDGTEFFFVDNLRIHDGGTITAGHWELRVDQSSAQTTGTDLNAIGIRADDGDDSSSGTELRVYYDSHSQYGVNPSASGNGSNSRSYTEYPYVTSGCSLSENDHDYDSNSGTVGSITLSDRPNPPAFTQTIANAALSANNVWDRNSVTGWTSDQLATNYGIWKMDLSISTYFNPGINGNYANVYFGNFQIAANPPAANPTTNAFRVYLPTDGNVAPVKPYLEQLLTHKSGLNPPAVGVASRYSVTVRLVNPTPQAITFSTPSNIVTARIPGSGAVYGGNAQVGQGSIVSQPAVGGTGDITWNPGTLAAGATAIMAYEVVVTPTSSGQRIAVTSTPASGNGTRAQWVDETGNTTQARATYLFGPLCELAVTQGLLTQATIAAFDVYAQDGGVVAEWRTASEAGTAGFLLYRWDAGARRWSQVGDGLLAGLLGAPQGGTYRVRDEAASPRERQRYLLVEVEADGGRRAYGPFERDVDWGRSRRQNFQALDGAYERTAGATRTSGATARRRASAAGALVSTAEAARPGAPADALRLAIRETGLYYLSVADLASWFGETPDKVEKLIREGKLSLSRNGLAAAWRPDFDAPGTKPKGIFFYGEAVDSLYTLNTAYKLRRDPGLGMPTVAVAPGPPAPPPPPVIITSFAESRHLERDLLPATALALDPDSDWWFWDFVQSGDATFGSRTFTVDAPGLAPAGAAALQVRLQGGTSTGVAGEHHAAVALNGTPLGEVQWTGVAAKTASFPVDAALLHAAGNQVTVSGVLDPGTPFSIFYLDSFDLSYPRLYRAAGSALAFRGGGVLTVAGFAAPEIALLDVRDPLRPRWLQGTAVTADGAGGYQVSFTAPAPGAYFAADRAARRAPFSVRAWSDPELRSEAIRADYLVVAAPGLTTAAGRLAGLRVAQGLSTRVVDLQQVADEFGNGLSTPLALRDFLNFALTRWRTPPRYVALAGVGSIDYRDLLGQGGTLVPPLLVAAPGGLFPADNRLAAPVAGGLPGAAIGRIPVRTAAELDAYVDKVAAYEAGAGGSWTGQALLAADAPDNGADFAGAAGRAGSLLPEGYQVQSIDLGTTPIAAAREQLFTGLASGATLFGYVGHGGLDRMSGSGLLTSADVASLPAATRLPVVTAMTCAVNRYAVPGVASLGELLTTRAGAGAIAVWAPSGLSDNGEAGLLAQRFYRLAGGAAGGNFGGATVRLGDVVRQALTELRSLGGSAGMVDIYNLLGDPALRFRRPDAPPATGGGNSGE